MKTPVFKKLTNTVVVNAAALRALTGENLGATLAEIYAIGLNVLMVEDITDFISGVKIRTRIADNTVTKDQLEYFLNRDLSEEDLATIEAYFKSRSAIDLLLGTSTPTYPYAVVPEGANTSATIAGNVVTRNGYRMSKAEFTKVWTKARKFWNGEIAKPRSFTVNADGHWNRTTNIKTDNVEIGCQIIPRWEVEQIATLFELPFFS